MSEQLGLSDEAWAELERRVSMELGVEYLWEPLHTYVNGRRGGLRYQEMCHQFMVQECGPRSDGDFFMKTRLDLVELGFRQIGEQIQRENSRLAEIAAKNAALVDALGGPTTRRTFVVGSTETAAANDQLNKNFEDCVHELNVRFRNAGVPLHYHNGYLQIASDEVTAREIEQPFWEAVSASLWTNVVTDMAQALDDRDNGGRDPAWHAAKALESTIKIISDAKGWTHGGEKGAHNYVDNIASKKAALLEQWEGRMLKSFFSDVRNDFGHGAGSDPMPALSPVQTQWAIEFCMSWIKALVRRSGL